MINNIFNKYCTHCEVESTFRYVSSVSETSAMSETHYYSCKCGETYPLKKLLTLENIVTTIIKPKDI